MRDTLRVRNAASLAALNAESQVAVAGEVVLLGSSARAIALSISADVLEVGLGETAPFTLVIRNIGEVPVGSLAVHDLLPEGGRYAGGSAKGVDSARAQGSNLTLFVAGPLAPGATRTIRYTIGVVSAATASLQTTAYASIDGAEVRSADAVAWLRVRTATPMEDRAVIGRVWVDANNNGVPDPGETGIDGIDIWTTEGDIASTDSAGRFSFRNIRPGHHGFRLDPASIPAGYRVADGGASRDMLTRDASGWTTPLVNFRLVPRGGHITRVRLPIAWSYSARPVESVLVGSGSASGPLAEADLKLLIGHLVNIRNQYPIPLRGLAIRFPAPLDSAQILVGDSVVARVAGAVINLPEIGPGARLQVRGWGGDRYPDDSASADLELHGQRLDRATRAIGSTEDSVARALAPIFDADTLPEPGTVPGGGEVEVVLDPPAAGWPGEGTFALPAGWVMAGSNRLVPSVIRDRTGSQVLLWRLAPGSSRGAPIVFRLKPAAAAGLAPEPIRVAALRTTEARVRERKRAFLDGPGIEIFAPQDGFIAPSDRLYVGVRGEANAPVALFDGDSLVAEATLRIDGVYDFIGIALQPGPHRLRARMANSWGQTRWDSLAVHATGRPARFSLPPPQAPISLIADGNTIQTVQIQVLDRWGVPVVNHPAITVLAKGAEPVNPDADPSSVGVQVVPDAAGWLALKLRPGRAVMKGWLRLSFADTTKDAALEVLPASQPLMVAAVGQVGVGASPEAFGAVTVRGRLDPRTSVVLSYDSRRLDAGRDAFGRSADPLEQAQYPILGDASAQRTLSASRYQLAARVERGFDWLALGDISTGSFGQDLKLSGYRRALPGLAGRVTTGPVVWEGFGSSTSQTLQQLQVRGAGISGPYQLTANIHNGTEQVVLEIRAEENAARVLSRQVLERFVDYQIDYDAGTLLFKRPVPAADTYGNPVFIVLLYEADSGGPRSNVWGVRAAVDGNRLLKTPFLDSVRVGGTWVRESPGAGDHQLLGADLHLARFGAVEVSGEVSWSRAHDSSGVAASASAGVTLLGGAGRLSASWLSVGREYGNPANLALRGGTEEVRLAGQLKNGTREFVLAHEWQRFDAQGIVRHHTTGTIQQSLGPDVKVQASLESDRFDGGILADASTAGEFKVLWKPEVRWTLAAEARHQFASEGTTVRPDYVGARASFDVTRAVALEVRQRLVFLPRDSAHYSVTDLGIRTKLGPGTEAFGSYQIAGVNGGHNAALIGLQNQLRVGQAWSFNTLFERRSGLNRASLDDPVRALPFLQVEEDYWSLGLGAELLPPRAPYRLSARGEYRDGNLNSTRLVIVAGDISLGRSLAVLTRDELLRTDQNASGISNASHRYSTLWGVALRPVHSDVLNVLAKFEAIDAASTNGGGVLTGPTGEGRTILAAEAIWQPVRRTELAARFAHRRTVGSLSASGGSTEPLRSVADFMGWRASLQVHRLLGVRADGRVLAEQISGSRRYDLAPQLVLLPQQALEIAAGYRLGNLRDPDFAVNGGSGWFVTFGVRVTEGTLGSAADFWRRRLSSHQP